MSNILFQKNFTFNVEPSWGVTIINGFAPSAQTSPTFSEMPIQVNIQQVYDLEENLTATINITSDPSEADNFIFTSIPSATVTKVNSTTWTVADNGPLIGRAQRFRNAMFGLSVAISPSATPTQQVTQVSFTITVAGAVNDFTSPGTVASYLLFSPWQDTELPTVRGVSDAVHSINYRDFCNYSSVGVFSLVSPWDVLAPNFSFDTNTGILTYTPPVTPGNVTRAFLPRITFSDLGLNTQYPFPGQPFHQFLLQSEVNAWTAIPAINQAAEATGTINLSVYRDETDNVTNYSLIDEPDGVFINSDNNIEFDGTVDTGTGSFTLRATSVTKFADTTIDYTFTINDWNTTSISVDQLFSDTGAIDLDLYRNNSDNAALSLVGAPAGVSIVGTDLVFAGTAPVTNGSFVIRATGALSETRDLTVNYNFSINDWDVTSISVDQLFSQTGSINLDSYRDTDGATLSLIGAPAGLSIVGSDLVFAGTAPVQSGSFTVRAASPGGGAVRDLQVNYNFSINDWDVTSISVDQPFSETGAINLESYRDTDGATFSLVGAPAGLSIVGSDLVFAGTAPVQSGSFTVRAGSPNGGAVRDLQVNYNFSVSPWNTTSISVDQLFSTTGAIDLMQYRDDSGALFTLSNAPGGISIVGDDLVFSGNSPAQSGSFTVRAGSPNGGSFETMTVNYNFSVNAWNVTSIDVDELINATGAVDLTTLRNMSDGAVLSLVNPGATAGLEVSSSNELIITGNANIESGTVNLRATSPGGGPGAQIPINYNFTAHPWNVTSVDINQLFSDTGVIDLTTLRDMSDGALLELNGTLPGGVTFDPIENEIIFSGSSPASSGSFEIRARASGGGGNIPLTFNYSFTVEAWTDTSITLEGYYLDTDSVNLQSYRAGSDGAVFEPVTSLPPGFELATDGTLSYDGTGAAPTTTSTAFAVRATSPFGGTGSAIDVNYEHWMTAWNQEDVTITHSDLHAGTFDLSPYRDTSDEVTVSVQSGSLPNGTTINNSTLALDYNQTSVIGFPLSPTTLVKTAAAGGSTASLAEGVIPPQSWAETREPYRLVVNYDLGMTDWDVTSVTAADGFDLATLNDDIEEYNISVTGSNDAYLSGTILRQGSAAAWERFDLPEWWSGTSAVACAADGKGTWIIIHGGRVYRSTDHGETFEIVLTVQGAHVDTDGEGTWIMTTNTQPRRSTDNGATWEVIDSINGSYIKTARDGVWIISAFDGNIWRSTDNGDNWSIIEIASDFVTRRIDTDRQGTWIIGSTEGRIARSTDNGITWDVVTPGFAAGTGQDPDTRPTYVGDNTWIVSATYFQDLMNPINNARVSRDGGITWLPLTLPLGPGSTPFIRPRFTANRRGVIVAVSERSDISPRLIIRSLDYGVTWEWITLDEPVTSGIVTGMASDEEYAWLITWSGSAPNRIMRSSVELLGTSEETLTVQLTSPYTNEPSKNLLVNVGGLLNPWNTTSIDVTQPFYATETINLASYRDMGDDAVLTLINAPAGVEIIGTDLVFTGNSPATSGSFEVRARLINGGFSRFMTVTYDLQLTPWDVSDEPVVMGDNFDLNTIRSDLDKYDYTVLASSQDYVLNDLSIDTSGTLSHDTSVLPFAPIQVIQHPSITPEFLSYGENSSDFDGDDTWMLLGAGAGASPGILVLTDNKNTQNFLTLPGSASRIRYGNGAWIACNNTTRNIYRTTNGGDSWENITAPIISGSGRGLRSMATDGDGTWVAGSTHREIIRSTDNGATWTAIVQLDDLPNPNAVTDIATDGAGTWIALLSTSNSNQAWRSTDDGLNWSPISISGSSEPRAERITYSGGTWIAASAQSGEKYVFRSTNSGNTWSSSLLETSFSGTPALIVSVASDGSGQWLTQAGPRLYRSVDDGVSWDVETEFTDADRVQFIVPGNNQDWIVGLTRTETPRTIFAVSEPTTSFRIRITSPFGGDHLDLDAALSSS